MLSKAELEVLTESTRLRLRERTRTTRKPEFPGMTESAGMPRSWPMP